MEKYLCQLFFSDATLLIYMYLIAHFQYLTVQRDPEVRVQSAYLHVGLYCFAFILICNMFCLLIPPGAEGVYKDRTCACMVL